MKQTGIIAICLMSVFICSLAAAATASAAEEVKEGLSIKAPPVSFPITYTSKNEAGSEAVIETEKTKIACSTETDTGTFENAHLGKTTVTLKGCDTTILGLKLKCFSEGATKTEEEEGIVKIELRTHLGVALAPAGTPHDGVLFLLPGSPGSFEIHCTKANKIVLKGEVIALFETSSGGKIEAATKYSKLLLAFKKEGAGKQNSTIFDLLLLAKPKEESGEMTGVHLTASLNGGTVEEASMESKTGLEGFTDAEGEAIEMEFERSIPPVEEVKEGLLSKLPAGSSFPVTYTSKSAAGTENVIETEKLRLICPTATGVGTLENAHLGKATDMFHGCNTTVLGVKVVCFSVGASKTEEEEGIIRIELRTHLGIELQPAGTAHDGVLSLLPGSPGSFTFDCTKSMVLEIKGEAIGLIETLSKSKIVAGTKYPSLLGSLKKRSAGKPLGTIFDLLLLVKPKEESGEMTGVHFTSSLNGGGAEEASLESEADLEEFKNSAGTKIEAEFERG